MITQKKEDLYHRAIMLRILNAFFNNQLIKENLAFKGGSAASMAGFLDRFSVDLDFDLLNKKNKIKVEKKIKDIVKNLNFSIKKTSKKELFFIVKYPSAFLRNSLKISVVDEYPKSNDYQQIFFPELNQFIYCQSIETMFANKLVVITDRYQKYKQLAGRDLYDLHYFFSHGYDFKKEIIQERLKITWQEYFKNLIDFIKKNFNQKIIDEDLNFLLPPEKFRAIRKSLINEVLFFLNQTIKA